MKLTTLEDVVESLKEMKNIVTVPDDIREAAKLTLDRMLKVPRDTVADRPLKKAHLRRLRREFTAAYYKVRLVSRASTPGIWTFLSSLT